MPNITDQLTERASPEARFFVPTCDPFVVIEEQRHDYIRYRNVDTGARWEVLGTCAATEIGPCSIGTEGIDLGPPEGRLDVPVTPDLECSLCVDGGHLTFRVL